MEAESRSVITPRSARGAPAVRALAPAAGVFAALAALSGCAASTGLNAATPSSRHTQARIVANPEPVTPTPTSSPNVRCIRTLTEALRTSSQDGSGEGEQLAVLRKAYGPTSAQLRAVRGNVAQFSRDARRYGPDVAAARVWPVLAEACASIGR